MNLITNDSSWIEKYGDTFEFEEKYLIDDTGSFSELADIYHLTLEELKEHPAIEIHGKKTYFKTGIKIKILKMGDYGRQIALCQTMTDKPIRFELISLLYDKYPIKVKI